MKHSLIGILALMTFTSFVAAQSVSSTSSDQTDLVFNQGTVLVTCGAQSPNEKVSTELFNEAFPRLVPALNEFIMQGKLIRAHYLGELKEGVFLAVGGDDRKDAMKNAQEIVAKTTEIIKNVMKNVEVNENFQFRESCRFMEVGPLFLKGL